MMQGPAPVLAGQGGRVGQQQGIAAPTLLERSPGRLHSESMISSRRWRLEMASSLSTRDIMVMATIWEV